LTQLMLNEKAKGKPTQKPDAKEKMHYHCDTFFDQGRD